MARRNLISIGCCCCCCNQRHLLAVILIFTIAMGAPHSDTSSTSANHFNPAMSPGFFATRNNTKVTAQKDGTALLPCTVLTQTSALVSWVRRRDFQLLTVGLSTYSSDDRFLVEHIRHMGHWALRIKAVRDEDRGLYECQLSVHPVQSVFIELNVVEAIADIVGAPDLHIDEGSTLRLECKLKQATEYPAYVFWYHEQNMVNFDQQNGFSVTPFQPVGTAASPSDAADQHHAPFHEAGRHHLHHHGSHQQLHHHHPHLHHQQPDAVLDEHEDDGSFGLNALELVGPPALVDPLFSQDVANGLDTESTSWADGDQQQQLHYQHHQWAFNHSEFLPYSHILSPATSVLTIKEVHSKHAGNYTCAPSNTRPASITVHVLQGEKPAAMQHANRSQLEESKTKGAAASNTQPRSFQQPAPLLVVLVLLLVMFQRPLLAPQRAYNQQLMGR